jgi:hypothetical protein
MKLPVRGGAPVPGVLCALRGGAGEKAGGARNAQHCTTEHEIPTILRNPIVAAWTSGSPLHRMFAGHGRDSFIHSRVSKSRWAGCFHALEMKAGYAGRRPPPSDHLCYPYD